VIFSEYRAVTTIEANKAVASSDLEKKEKNNRERERKGGGLVNGIIFPAEKLHLFTH
jgi:hypothetical protein